VASANQTMGPLATPWRNNFMKTNRIVTLAVSLLAAVSFADPVLRRTFDQRGDIIVVGNTLAHDCNGTENAQGTPGIVVGNTAACRNPTDDGVDVIWQSDAPAAGQAQTVLTTGNTTSARSKARLTIPLGSQVSYARLYWTASLVVAPITADTNVTLSTPFNSTAVTADQTWTDNQNGTNNYQGTSDVTDFVRAYGSNVYQVSNVDIGVLENNVDAFASWTLVVVYRQETAPLRNLTVFDGFDFTANNGAFFTFPVNGFLYPLTAGQANAWVVAYEGDNTGATGDTFEFHSVRTPLPPFTTITDGLGGGGFFNSSRTIDGVIQSIAGDLPQSSGQRGTGSHFDLDRVDVTALMNPLDTGGEYRTSTTGDVFYIGPTGFSFTTFEPDFTNTYKSYVDLNGGSLVPGDVIQFTITTINSGNDTAINVILNDLLNVGQFTYVANSMVITDPTGTYNSTAGATDSAADADRFSLIGGTTLRAFLGTGAASPNGGTMLVGQTATLVFRATINAAATGVLSNIAAITAVGQTAQMRGVPANTWNSGQGGIPNKPVLLPINDLDFDDDGLPNSQETNPLVDTDGDGLVNQLDPDSDNDGILDGTERGCRSVTPPNSNAACSAFNPIYTDITAGNFLPDNDPTTVTSMVLVDTDGGGVSDGIEDIDHDGQVDPGERNPLVAADDLVMPPLDSDGDGLSNAQEILFGTNPFDNDSDDDGVTDGAEPNWSVDTDGDGRINALDPDSDNDGIFDGTERGITMPATGTNVGAMNFIPDADPTTTTSMLLPDTDGDGLRDGQEDVNRNGRFDPATEANPNDIDTDDDGVVDGSELSPFVDTDMDMRINVNDPDSDNDLLFDGTERGITVASAGTNVGAGFFTPDADPLTTTNSLVVDTDGGGVGDGVEDTNRNGRVDAGERNPTLGNGADDQPLCTVPSVVTVTPAAPASIVAGSMGTYSATGGTPGTFTWTITPAGATPASGAGTTTGTVTFASANTYTVTFTSTNSATPAFCTPAGVRNGSTTQVVTAAIDTDGDGIADTIDQDDDNDGILDNVEGANTDTDGDLVPDRLDLDSDNDGILDITESGQTTGADGNGDGRLDGAVGTDGVPDSVQAVGMTNSGTVNYIVVNTDGDLVPDFRDLDSDNDGINDVREANGTDADANGIADGAVNALGLNGTVPAAGLVPPNTDGDSRADFRDLDSDNDGLNDVVEAGLVSLDTDGNGIVGTGAVPADGDGDGIANVADSSMGYGDAQDPTPLNTDGDSKADYRDLDSDNDGLNDVVEAGLVSLDTDGNGIVGTGAIPADGDNDGIADVADGAVAAFGDANDPAARNTDGDGRPDFRDLDSDNDGINDVIESGVLNADTDNNGIVGTGAIPADTDGDGIADVVDGAGTFGDAADPAPLNSDNDTVPNFRDLDSDNDTVADVIEGGNGPADTNGDGTVSAAESPDADGDGIPLSLDNSPVYGDAGNAPLPEQGGADVDLIPDYIDLDSDQDGLTDLVEAGRDPSVIDMNGDGQIDSPIVDPDGDGVPNIGGNDSLPAAFGGTQLPVVGVDTDGDGIPDNADQDDDNDGILDNVEGATTDTDGDLVPDRLDLDSDNDGILDITESGRTTGADGNGDGRLDGAVGTDGVPDSVQAAGMGNSGTVNYTVVNTDGDAVPDFRDLDTDNDGINDVREANGTDANGDGLADGVVNAAGVRATVPAAGLNPPDTDSDTRPDFRDLDSDNDGINDVVESGNSDADNNGIVGTGAIPADADNDGIATIADGSAMFGDATDAAPLDSDTDLVPNYRDLDSDNDTVADVIEGGNGAADTNGNGTISPAESGDTDGDGIPNSVDNSMLYGDAGNIPLPEQGGLDTDTIPDYIDLDSDQDGLTDLIEAGRNPAIDANNDGVVDAVTDPDGDGVPNNAGNDSAPAAFGGTTLPVATTDSDADGIPDSVDLDDDNDGILDSAEGPALTTDTDGDGVPDRLDLDSDNDGILDITESGRVTGADANGDGRLDGSVGTDGVPDSLQPGAPNGGTVNYTIVDTDGDMRPDFRDLDSDNDGLYDVREANGTDANGDGRADGAVNAVGVPATVAAAGLVPPNTDGSGPADFRDLDSDNDGINDVREANGTDADGNGLADGAVDVNGVPASVPATGLTPPDTDGDARPDYRDLDSDNDGINDVTENGGIDPDNNGIIGTGATPTDTDNDGIADVADGAPATFGDLTDPALANGDNDPVPNFRDLDSDNDSIADVIEGGNAAADTNGDGTISPTESADPDNDGIPASVDNAPAAFGDAGNPAIPEQGGADTDTIPDYLDLDSDQDGLTDLVEAGRNPAVLDTNGDGQIDSPILDPDGDGVPNNNGNDTLPNVFGGTTPPAMPGDLDGDGIPDVTDLDDDNDGILDTAEGSGTVDTDGDMVPDSRDLDSDNDGIYDSMESGSTTGADANFDGRVDGPVGTDGVPNSVQPAAAPNGGMVNYTIVDTDGDGKPDFRDLDSDNDGINDVRETNGTDLNNDGIADGAPTANGVPATSPTGARPPDTDGDLRPDFRDLDSDNDGINDVVESGNPDPDNNGIVGMGQIPADGDNDGIADVADGSPTFGDAMDALPLNSDNDPVPNYRDLDSDNDTVADVIEGGNGAADTNSDGTVSPAESSDPDGDGIMASLDNAPMAFGDAGNAALPEQGGADTDTIPDYIDTDSDQDGLTDLVEAGRNPAVLDANGDGVVDAPADPDGDGIPNNSGNDTLPAVFGGATPPMMAGDTDGDMIPDVTDLDDDNDGILDSVEGATTDTDGDGIVDRLDLDSDNDGIADVTESGRTTGVDANGDGRLDGTVGTDGIPDSVQSAPNNMAVNYAVVDTDGDMRPDFRDLDSDNDGLSDVREANGTDANGDGRADGAPNAAGVPASAVTPMRVGLNPPDTDGDMKPDFRDLDSDNDGINDVREIGGVDANNDGIADGVPNANGVPASVPATGITPRDTDGDGRPDFRDLDSDNDGINDVVEAGNLDPDNNGIVGSGQVPVDMDGDGIPDAADGSAMFGDSGDMAPLDSDGDSVPNYRDLDSDNDTVADVIEGGNGMSDTNGDGTISPTESPDTDNDGIPNSVDNAAGVFGDAGNQPLPEQGGADTDMIPDYLDPDSDGDGLTDLVEAGRNPAILDMNGDGAVDSPADPDGDGIPNNAGNDTLPMVFGGASPPVTNDTDGDMIPDAVDLDDDNDGILDAAEGNGTVDTDGDMVPDSRDLDSDNDGLLDIRESGRTTGVDANSDGRLDGAVGTDGIPDSVQAMPNNGMVNYTIVDTDGDMKPDFRDLDSDNDGINDVREANGTDANGDGRADGAVNASGVPNSPPAGGLVPPDTDGDMKPDFRDLDSDNDGINDVVEAGLADPDNNGIVGMGQIPTDTDNDGIADVVDGAPAAFGDAMDVAPLNSDNDTVPNYRDLDSDNDTVADVIEGGNGAADTNGDGTISPMEGMGDTDNDGIPNVLDNAPAVFGDSGNAALPEQGGADTDMIPDYLDPDSDGDGLTDLVEAGRDPAVLDANGDGQVDNPADPDGDGIPNNGGNDRNPNTFGGATLPGMTDTDGDGIVDASDLDDDNDGILDAVEGVTTDTDGDGIPDRLDLDSDNDSILDMLESGATTGVDANGDGRLDGMVGTDGIPNSVQAMPNDGSVNYTLADTDGDMKPDFRDLDSDNDGLNDVRENNGTDANGNGLADGAVGASGLPASVTLPVGALVDTDGDMKPDFRDLDSDNDGINDVLESGLVDPDNDGIVGTGARPMDSDSDGIADVVDGAPMMFGDAMDAVPLNSDNDPIPNYRDLDSDNDSISDVIEGGNAAADTDKDGTISPTEGMGDTDGDGIPNVLDNAPTTFGDAGNAALPEQGAPDTDTIPDFIDTDSDGDGVTDFVEAGGNPMLDMNGDGQIDNPVDADKDGIPDNGGNDTKPGVFGGTTPPKVVVDTDMDGIPDNIEMMIGTNPNDADSDDDGVLDGAEPSFSVDSDGDGLINALDPDSDNDGLFDGTELGITTASPATDTTKGNFIPDADPTTKTDPLDADTDNGSVSDGNEDLNHNGRVDMGETNPNVMNDDVAPTDTDMDGIADVVEMMIGTNPMDADSDDDGVLDGAEPNFANDTDGDGKINALDPDSDNDGLKDGTELGITMPNADTNVAAGNFVPDADPTTKTNPLIKDTDNGGVTDGDEDTNKNGKVDAGERDPNVKADDMPVGIIDTDKDGIPDSVEGMGDADGDGIPNYLDLDSDGDGIPDSVEAGDADLNTPPVDTDKDGTPDYLDLDSDNDGIPDAVEGNVDTDGDGIPDFRDTDSDNDGVLDGKMPTDNCRLVSNATQVDTDKDGIGDACDIDANGDGLVDNDISLAGGSKESGCGCNELPTSSAFLMLAVVLMFRRRSQR
jgi:large repetitive protein